MNQYRSQSESVRAAKARRRPHAVTLMEAVIASFLLLSAFLVVVNLFNSGLGHMSRTENQQLAAMLAERELERMRIWSETLNGTQYNYTSPGLASFSVSVADYPGFAVATRVTPTGLYSGCSNMEQAIASVAPLRQPRYLPGQASKVVVTVSWANGQKSLKLASLFSEPALRFSANPINISGGSTSLAPDGSADFSASAVDSNGQPINGLMFSWSLLPIDGAGTLDAARDGSTARLTNRIYGPPFNAPDYVGTVVHTGGTCQLQVSAMYHGKVFSANTSVVNL